MIPGYIEPIDADDCRRLLGGGRVGRVAWVSGRGGVQVLPVNFLFDGTRVLFSVAPHGVMAELARPTEVVFQLDDIDPETSTGWSVLARGTSGPYDGDPEVVEGLPWAPGRRDLALAIAVTELSGRVVSADDEG